MNRAAMAVVSLSCAALLAGSGSSAVTSGTSASISSAQVDQLAGALAATGRYGPSCEATRVHRVEVLPILVGLGKGTLLSVDALPLLSTAHTAVTADAVASPGLSDPLLAVADDFGRIRVVPANLRTADLGPLTTHLRTLATGCGVD